MKKILSILLAGIITFSSMWLIPTSVNAAETTTNVQSSGVEKTGVPLCQANIIANGYNNDGDSYYNLLKSMQDPLYYTLTELMLDDGVLCWTSNFWNAAFNSDFQRNPSYFYEVMLMGFLKYDQKQLDTSGVWNSQEMSLATSIYDKLADKYIDKFENPSYKDFLKQLKEIPKDEYENIISNIDDIKISKELLGTLSSGCSNAVELVEAVSEYQVLLNAKSERIEMLKLAKSKVTDNEYFTKAVDDIIAHMEETSIDYVSGKLMEKIWNNFLDTAWDLIVKDSPIAPILAAIDIEKMTLDVLFNSSETASNNFKLLVLYTVDTYFRSALDKSYNDYKSNGTVENAEILIQCYKAYIEYQVYGLDYTKTFIDGIVDGGPIHSIVEQIFFKENIENAAELNNFCDTQINNRKRLLELLEKSADNYYKSTGLDELVDAIQSGDSEVNIPVTGISFKNSEITLNSTEDICLINADVYPQNATNKKVVYTSSDPSILSVPSDGGFASQKGKGTVIVTATTEDGGFTATQTVNVGYNLPSTVIDKGKCGYGAYWTLYSDGKLYISGEGNINDFEQSYYNSSYDTPWYFYRENINTVKISNDITRIGDYAFCDCANITSITIQNSVTSIGYAVFANCESLTNITIPNSVTSIGDYTFNNCKSLTSITIPNGVTSIGGSVFEDCTSLTSITIPNSVTSIGNFTFYGCTSLTSITIPNSVTSIGYAVFSNCESLTNITIPDSVTRIDNRAFQNCKSLKSITIPDSVTRIGEFTFSGCESLKSITIPDGIEWICQHTFARCTSLTSVIIPDSVTSIDTSAFKDCTSLKSITIPDSVTSIDTSAFKDCRSLTSIKIPDSVTSIESSTFENCTSLTSIAIPNSVTSIESSAFYGCKSLTSVTIPDSVTSIGDYTFDYCTSLASVTIPDSVTRIGEGAFGSTSLTSITIPDSVTSIGDYTFASCTSLTSITIPDSVTSIGEGAFRDCTNLTSITIPDSVASIEKRAFRDCTNLTSITIPDSVASIGESTFENCTSLTSITIPNSVTSIGDYTFNNCKSLTIITIPDSVTSIGDYTFRNCTSLTSITIPDSVTSIGECAFMYCENLTIYGYKNTAAEEYALNNGFEFINLAEERTLTDKASSISVSGVVNSNADLNVSKLENTYEKSVATYDITLQKDGIAIQPDGAITIKIPSDVKDCKVMWLKDDGTAEDMNAEYIDGCYVFTTNHLSVYALVQNKQYLKGDANQDGIVNVNDVTYLQRHLAGRLNTDGSALIDETNKSLFDCLDLNKDVKLTVEDITELQVYIIKNN
ncbi:leucine-rich repeat protein [Ruminococcus sp.]|uniref:leucine-rich repeat protein n=1 Tax=Ruminococcus sp. TaxID=41978 RepID=UPI003FD77B81